MCRPLARLVYGGAKAADVALASAAAIFAHENEHLGGVFVESLA